MLRLDKNFERILRKLHKFGKIVKVVIGHFRVALNLISKGGFVYIFLL